MSDLRIDATGKRCPIPVIELAKHITDVDIGQEVQLLADDPAAAADVAAWCRMRAHDYLGAQDIGGGRTSYTVRRTH